MTLWLLAVMPTRFPAPTRSTIIRAPGVGLAGAGRALDRRAPLRSSASAIRRAASSSVSSRPPERRARRLSDVGRSPQEQVARRAVRAVARRCRSSATHSPSARSAAALALVAVAVRAGRRPAGCARRVQPASPARIAALDRRSISATSSTRSTSPAPLAGSPGRRRRAAPMSWSCGGKRVAPRLATASRLGDRLPTGSSHARSARARRRSSSSVSAHQRWKKSPPRRLSSRRCQSSSWASSQRAALLGVVRSAGSSGTPAVEPLDERPRPRLALGQLGGRGSVAIRGAAGRGTSRGLRSSARDASSSQSRSRQVAHDVVAVVALDRGRGWSQRRAGRPRRARATASNATMLEPASRRSTSRSKP